MSEGKTKKTGEMSWCGRDAARYRTLRVLLRDTVKALRDADDVIPTEASIWSRLHTVSTLTSRPPLLLLWGSLTALRRLLTLLLGVPVLPSRGVARRWIRIKHGAHTQTQLTLANSEFELVEELQCCSEDWTELPEQNISRQTEQDYSTVLEIEMNCPLLKDGLQIMIPPNPESGSEFTYQELQRVHTEFYTKRESILNTLNPIHLYVLDRIGKNIFSDSFCDIKLVPSSSDDDFWSSFNLYSMASMGTDKTDSVSEQCEAHSDNCDSRRNDASDQPFVFGPRECMDLYQIKKLNPNAQMLFLLFSDSRTHDHRATENTESKPTEVFSTDDLPESDQSLAKDRMSRLKKSKKPTQQERQLLDQQTAFLNDLLEQWEMFGSPPSKHGVKTQWLIINEEQIKRTPTQKPQSSSKPSSVPTNRETSSGGCIRNNDTNGVAKSFNVLASKIVKFAADTFHTYLLEYSTRLSEIHVLSVQRAVLFSFDLARRLQAIPARIHFVSRHEQLLYETLHNKFSEGDKKTELVRMMDEVLAEMYREVDQTDWALCDITCHNRNCKNRSSIYFESQPEQGRPDCIQLEDRVQNAEARAEIATEMRIADQNDSSDSEVEEAMSCDSYNLEDYDIIEPDESLSDYYSCNIGCTTEMASCSMCQSTLLHTAVENVNSLSSCDRHRCVGNTPISTKVITAETEQIVLDRMSKKISTRLVNYVDCLKESYFGTLERCVSWLERCVQSPQLAGGYIRVLSSVPGHVTLPRDSAGTLVQLFRRLFLRLRALGGKKQYWCEVCERADNRRRVARRTIDAFTATRLALICTTQIIDRLKSAHERFSQALSALETSLSQSLHQSEDAKLAIRKKYAPQFARLCLESTSMCDLLKYGTPELGREIGRGQYGVVFACRAAWRGVAVAAKSVLPGDAAQLAELALECYYTRIIPPHPRIVPLLGSIMSRAAAGPSVLLISPRYEKDLHAALRGGLAWKDRLQIALDIVVGIRYLHSLGVVHRDVKLKNVLVSGGRGALADLGFARHGALLSGSVVGTPAHMAPELLRPPYDNSVDVYAFAVLFWYMCAGTVRLPAAFEAFKNKEQLWSKVKKGLRPERLPHFSDECWDIMQSCWSSDPSQRPLLGEIQTRLERLLEIAERDTDIGTERITERNSHGSDVDSDLDSLDISGIISKYM